MEGRPGCLKMSDVEFLNSVVKMVFLNSHDAYIDYHLQSTFDYQIRLLGFLKRARAELRV